MPRRKRGEESGERGGPTHLIDAIVARLKDDEDGDAILSGSALASASDYIPTGNLAVDLSLNMPGIPVGRLTVVRGWESSGKSSLVTHILAQTQKRGGQAVLLDAEFAYDDQRAARMGLHRCEGDETCGNDLLLAQPETVEQSINLLEKTIKAIRAENPDVLTTIVWDSVGGSPTKAQIEGEFGESKAMGEHAKVMSAALRRIMPVVAKENIALVIVNQNRELLQTGPLGSAEGSTMIARRPLQFHASLMIEMRKVKELREGDKDSPAYGILARAKVTKNKCSNPFGKADVVCRFDVGFDDAAAHFQVAQQLGMITKKGAWYKMADVGDESFYARDFERILEAHEGLRAKIAQAAYEEFWPETVRQRYPAAFGGSDD